ncbi:acetylxylan esterase [Victivallis vadensis]|uniref:acetylxylan esterase n=1 Tax=Victivallis vadensis TaxID=172901 RepID=UPI00266D1DBA|nr:acetylxylan esterase [Victivallis vadensis]
MVRVDVQPLYDKLCPEWNLPDAAEKPATRLGVRSLVPEAVYAPGEPITFLVAMIENNQYRSGVGLKCRMIRDYHEPVEFPLVTRDTPVEVSTELERPGFVRLEVTLGELSAAAGAGVEPEKIAAVPDITGFDSFWRAHRRWLNMVQPRVLKREVIPAVLPEYGERVRCFDVQVACAGAKPVSGILSMPRGAKPKSCPAYVFFHGAGVRPAFQPLTWAARGLLAFNVNAHGLYNDLSEADYRALAEGPLKDYAKQPVYSAEDSVFRDMILRVQRALEFMKSLPEWDGRFLIVHGGSQGALQALAAAALDRDVSFVVANAPAMCDQAGELAGRMSPWPHAISQAGMERVAPFFDGAAFARRITAPARFTVGFSDTESTPSSVYAAFNACGSCDKEILNFPDCGHAGAVFWTAEAEIMEHLGR